MIVACGNLILLLRLFWIEDKLEFVFESSNTHIMALRNKIKLKIKYSVLNSTGRNELIRWDLYYIIRILESIYILWCVVTDDAFDSTRFQTYEWALFIKLKIFNPIYWHFWIKSKVFETEISSQVTANMAGHSSSTRFIYLKIVSRWRQMNSNKLNPLFVWFRKI